jgi:Ca-activated chloride channel family protein
MPWSEARHNKPKTLANVSYNSLKAPFGDVRMRQANRVTLKEEEHNTEAYAPLTENAFLAVAQNPLSTFSIDVDTAAYSNLRRFLASGTRPPRDSVRIEELVNYFPYRYAAPKDQTPFAASMEVASAPWTPEHRLVRIGLKGREVTDAARPKANLVFLLDVSGSMDEPNKLPLVKQSLRMLVGKLRPDDRVAIVVYAGASGMALPSTSAREQSKIIGAIDQLAPEGSTNGAAGIQLAYDIAKANFVAGGVNRVILATDGDFNVGMTSESELITLIEEKAKSGVFLTVLGFGMGNYKDSMLEKLADKGNGNYAYIDNAAEARKSLIEQAGGTLVTIAKDVKIQVEFNPAKVQAYRLIGYENRVLRAEDFNNDKVDAGEIGAGHTVTALYELVPAGAAMPETGSVDALKYQKVEAKPATAYAASAELLTLKVRYKEPTGETSRKLEFPLRDSDHTFEQASPDFKFAASVAAFGMILRDSPHKGAATFADVTNWAQSGIEDDAGGYRSEFIELVHTAETLVR